ncbi:MAG TPA: SDR family oxidoreductase [Armatimonadota bacterium]|nr:SDR family oxidoreductase [Armatimonadota bacterium]
MTRTTRRRDLAQLSDKALVVVGGTTGIGLSAARAFAAAGASVVVVGRSPENAAAAAAALGPRGRAITGDAADPETAPLAIRESLDQFGGFHGLYHVAGGSGRRQGDGPLHEITDSGWAYTIDENLTSLFLSNRAAVQRWMSVGEGGSVLNIGSVLGSSPSPHYFSTHAYAAAKAAVIGLTRASASYYAPYNIRFNVIAPGLVDTPMARRAAGDPAILEFVHTKQPLDGGRIGKPEDLDAAAIYFLSDASRFVTGQVLTVDGGWSVSEGQYV